MTQGLGSRRAGMLGMLVLLSVILAGCGTCSVGPGIVDVIVADGSLYAYSVADPYAEEPVVSGWRSDDLGVEWIPLPAAEVPPFATLPAAERFESGEISVTRRGEYCDADGCYVLYAQSIAYVTGGVPAGSETVWSIPRGRAEYLLDARWDALDDLGSDGRCDTPARVGVGTTSIDGGTIGPRTVVAVGAGQDGVLLSVDGGEFQRIGVGPWQPRPYSQFLNGLGDGELIPAVIVASLGMLLVAAMLDRDRRGREDDVAPAPGPRRWLARVVMVLAAAVMVGGAVVSISLWPLVMLVAAAIAALLVRDTPHGGAGSGRWVVAAGLVPLVAGWLPVVGWTLGTPAVRASAVRWSTVLALASAAVIVLVLRRTLEPAPSRWEHTG